MTHDFWGKFGTYLGHHVKNKTMVKFTWDNKTTSKKGDMIRKEARTTTSTRNVSQSRLSDESDILLKIFETTESTHDKTEGVVHQGEFINFQVLFQHKYYTSNYPHFLAYLLCF